MLALNAIVVVVIQYPVIQICKKYTPLVSIMVGTLFVSGGLFGFGIIESTLGAAICTIIFTIGEVLMFSMTDVFIDDIAVAHLKRNIFRGDGLFGNWSSNWSVVWGRTSRLLRVPKWVCSIFSASYIFNCSVSSAVSYEKFIEKRYDGNSNIELHAK